MAAFLVQRRTFNNFLENVALKFETLVKFLQNQSHSIFATISLFFIAQRAVKAWIEGNCLEKMIVG